MISKLGTRVLTPRIPPSSTISTSSATNSVCFRSCRWPMHLTPPFRIFGVYSRVPLTSSEGSRPPSGSENCLPTGRETFTPAGLLSPSVHHGGVLPTPLPPSSLRPAKKGIRRQQGGATPLCKLAYRPHHHRRWRHATTFAGRPTGTSRNATMAAMTTTPLIAATWIALPKPVIALAGLTAAAMTAYWSTTRLREQCLTHRVNGRLPTSRPEPTATGVPPLSRRFGARV